jgi:hypothetical protein
VLRPANAIPHACGIRPSEHYERLGRFNLAALSSVRTPPSAGEHTTLRWLPVPQDLGQCVLYAVLVLASKELRVNSVAVGAGDCPPQAVPPTPPLHKSATVAGMNEGMRSDWIPYAVAAAIAVAGFPQATTDNGTCRFDETTGLCNPRIW